MQNQTSRFAPCNSFGIKDKAKCKKKNTKRELPGVQRNVLLAPFTTFKIGGPAKYFFTAKTKEEVVKAILWAKKQGLAFFILGGGSNLLVADEGYDGVAIKIKNQKSKIKMTNQNVKRIEAEAGTSLSQVLALALKNNLTGLEWAAGIPKITVGGAVRGNAGAFGSSMKDIVRDVEVFDCRTEKIRIFKNKDCQFKYRDSVFKRSPNLIILSAEFELKKGKKLAIEKKIKEYLAYRKKAHPLQFPSAGSIFKNQKPKTKNQKLLEQFPELKIFKEKGVIPAGFLIEKAGLKGKKIGQAQVSEKHANFIVNLGGAQARDVVRLIKLIKEQVKAKFGIDLKEEIKYLG